MTCGKSPIASAHPPPPPPLLTAEAVAPPEVAAAAAGVINSVRCDDASVGAVAAAARYDVSPTASRYALCASFVLTATITRHPNIPANCAQTKSPPPPAS